VASANFTGKVTNKYGGYGFVDVDQTPVNGSATAGSKVLGRYVYSVYSGSIVVSLTSVGGTAETITVSLALTSTLAMSKQPSAMSFPDVFTGGARTITYKNAGKTTVSRVSAVNAARMDSIKWLASVGVTAGSQSDQSGVPTYRPQDTVNRGAMAQFLQKLAGFTDAQIAAAYAGKATKFTDIANFKSSNPARYYAILWLADTGITAGCNTAGTQYCPSNVVNRGAMAEFMRKFVGVAATPASSSPFPDVNLSATTLRYDGASGAVRVPAVSAARMGAINWMASTGITAGSGSSGGKTTYRAQDSVNRGGMAQFMHKLAILLGSTTYPAQ
jgi:hypothetical protein